MSILDVAELHPKAATTVPTIRKVISLYRSIVSFYTKFSSNDGNILVADSCNFTPERKGCVIFPYLNSSDFPETASHATLFSPACSGGLTSFAYDDGSRQLLDISRKMEENFVTFDASGNQISPAHRFLNNGCTPTFLKPDCLGSCTSCPDHAARVSCRARKLKCMGSSVEGLSFPFMSDPMKVIGLFSGGDIE